MKAINVISVAIITLYFPVISEAQNIEYTGSTLWTWALDLDVEGNYAFCAFQNGHVIYDISNPEAPFPVSRFQLFGDCSDVFAQGNFLYCLDFEDGLIILDISDIFNPSLVSLFSEINGPTGIFVDSIYCYLTDRDLGFSILDISNPNAPNVIGQTILRCYGTDVFVKGNYAYVGSEGGDEGYLEIIDISDKNNPSEIGSAYTIGVFDVFVSGDYAYLAAYNVFQSKFVIVDISEPVNPIIRGQYNTGGVYSKVTTSGNFAYLGGPDNHLSVVDISNPSNPHLERTVDLQSSPSALDLRNDFLFGISVDGRLYALDNSIPSEPSLVGEYASWDRTYGICISANYLYVSTNKTGLAIAEIFDPQDPFIAGSYDTAGWNRNVYKAGDYAYLADGDSGIAIVNVADPEAPVLTGTCSTPFFARDISVIDDYAFVACGDPFDGSFIVLDISDRSNPILAAAHYTQGILSSIFIDGLYAYVINEQMGLEIFDIARPTVPIHLTTWQFEYLRDIYVRDSLAFALSSKNLNILNISEPSTPTLVGSFSNSYNNGSMYVDGDYAFIASLYTSGISIVDISNPSDPELFYSFLTPGVPHDIAVVNDYLYVSDHYSVMIYHFDPETEIIEAINDYQVFALNKNYPNPFNVRTTISYNLPEQTDVKIEIYDILGRKIETLLEASQAAGSHAIVWDAVEQPSGIYFYTIEAGDYSDRGTCILLK